MMNILLKVLAYILLLLNGTGALFGGWHLMTHPDGSSLQMPLAYLKYSPFSDYFIPGIILFCANGIFSFVVLAAIVFHHRKYTWFIMAQGAILLGWIIIQLIMIQIMSYLHIVFGSIGLILLACGWILHRRTRHT